MRALCDIVWGPGWLSRPLSGWSDGRGHEGGRELQPSVPSAEPLLVQGLLIPM